ncbi:MAG: hypothetical protein AMS19_11580 [Gemmatimonas sp. SG8_23]|nr:MAG: hypothetical protein AMS19_11580 [Gemmatimonas sp. SG8_23]
MPRPSPILNTLTPLRGLAALAVAATVACGGGASQETIARDVFIATYVDLRVAALDTDSGRVAAADRDEILRRHGVSAEDLRGFADVHAADLEYMRDVWNEVEAALDVQPEDESRSGNGSD